MSGYDEGGGFVTNANINSSQQRSNYSDKQNTVRPVTIKQILGAREPSPDDGTTIDGKPVGRIKFVGVVRNRVKESTAITYRIEDGTGTVDIKKYITRPDIQDDADGDAYMDDDQQQQQQQQQQDPSENIPNGSYVAVIGQLRTFNNRRTINTQSIKVITDYNEVVFHHLNSIAVHLQLSRGAPTGKAGGNSMSEGSGLFVSNQDGVDSLGTKILQYLQSKTNNGAGVSVAELSMNLYIDRLSLVPQLEAMSDNGLVYDDGNDHYFAL